MAEKRNILILGASTAGQGAAHYIARHTIPKLQAAKKADYHITVVDPSTHFWWHISAPRAIVDVSQIPHEKYFLPIKDGFKQYSYLQDKITFIQGSATELDTQARTVTIKATGSEASEKISYYALVIATGVQSPTPLTTLHGDHNISIRALNEANTKIKTAKEVLIAGGGPVGVETAGEIAYHPGNKAHVTLITGGKKLLPVFNQSRATKAQKLLEKLGVTVQYNTKIEKTEEVDGKTRVSLSNGEVLTVDVYIPAYGVQPNTEWLPSSFKSDKGHIKINPETFRIDAAGPRVYAVGDVTDVDRGGALALNAGLPVWGANFNHDIFADAGIAPTTEKKYTPQNAETQLVPIGPKSGIVAFNGFGLPSFIVSMVKGKDYMGSMIPNWTEGKQFSKP